MSSPTKREAACKYCGQSFVQELQEDDEGDRKEFGEFWYPPFCESASCTQTDNAISEAAISHERAHTSHAHIACRIIARAKRLQWALESKAPNVVVRDFGRMLTEMTAEMVRRKPSRPGDPILYREDVGEAIT